MTQRARMLLVEDDAALAELLRWHFERESFDVRHTADGEEALLLAKEATPDIVLLDWMVEGLPGIEVCRRLRRSPDTANVPIIMLTARGEEEDRVRGLETGADDYVTKPFSPRELVARVSAVLRRVRPALAGEIGNDTLTGGADSDRFWINGLNSGQDTVTDFQNGLDKIRITGVAGVDDFGDLTVTANGSGWAVVTFPDGSTMTLTGVTTAQIDASDFVWS